MTTTLTDRYVEAALRHLPARQRPDIEKELRGSIADAVDDLQRAGTDPAQAEHAALVELGDPARLAAAYTDHSLHLIGPAFYPQYTRLLAALLATVLPTVAVAIAVAQTVAGATAATVLSRTTGTTITVGVHLAFWTTLAFATIERTHAVPARTWTPADLPPSPAPRARLGGLLAGTLFLGLFTTFVLLSPTISTQRDAAGKPIGILSPWLWHTGMVYLYLAFAITGLGFTFAEPHLRWTIPAALTRIVVDAVCPTILIYVAVTHRVLNPAFVSAAGWPTPATRWTTVGLTILGTATLLRTAVQLAAGIRRRTWVTPNWNTLIHTAVDEITHLSHRRSAQI
ncbi:MAG TPA: permease prefix domain 1-containing protein [Rugosimonospora sp.]|nr:permease prefix domain 1-containing protein [Rugosimonospora sp.]